MKKENLIFNRVNFSARFTYSKATLLTLLLFIVFSNSNAQTFTYNAWVAGSTSYSTTAGGNTMSVAYTESANNRTNSLASTTCFSSPTTLPNIPFYYNVATMNIADYSSSTCYCSASNAQSGLVLAANWANNNATNFEQITITFTNPVCGATFNIWDINQNFWSGDGSTYFTDKIDISGTDASSNPITAANIGISNCGSNTVTTSGNTKTITGVQNGCNCGSHSVTLSGTVKTITIKYYPGGSTYNANPWSQYVILTSVVATAAPTAGITPGALACGSSSTTLTATTNASSPTYAWTGPGGSTITNPNAASTSVTGAGTYTVTITSTAGCTNTATYTLTPSGSAPNLTAANDQTVTCSNPTISASSTDPVTYSWSGPGIVSGGATSSPTVNQSGSYTVIVTNTLNGCTNTATINVTANTSPPGVTPGSPLALNCSTSSGTITATPGIPNVNYLWSGPGIISGGTSQTPTVNAAGTYTVTVTSTTNGCTSTATVAVTSNTTPPTAIMGAPFSLTCTTLSGNVSVTTNAGSPSYLWAGPGIVSGGTTSSPVVNASGTYSVTVTNLANGCTNTGSVSISSNTAQPNVTAGSPLTLNCIILSGQISASTGIANPSYSWSGPGIVSGGTTSSPTVNSAGSYVVTVTNPANGCTGTTTVAVTTNTNSPAVTASSSLVLNCSTTSGTVNASTPVNNPSYLWSGPGIVSGGNTSSPTVNATGSYTVTITDPANGCTGTSSVSVSGNFTTPNVAPGSAQALSCVSPTVSISASSSTGGAQFTWTDGSGNLAGSTPTSTSTTVGVAGTYTVTVTNPINGCTSTATITVSPNAGQPQITIDPAPSITCVSSSATITGSSSTTNVSYAWTDASGNPAGSNPTQTSTTVSTPGTYTLTITDNGTGCSSIGNITVVLNNQPPTVTIANPSLMSCDFTPVSLSGITNAGNASFAWTNNSGNPAGTTPSAISTNVNAPGEYTITVLNLDNGCSTSAMVTVELENAPIAFVASASDLTCSLVSISLDGTGSATGTDIEYSWSGPGIITGNSTMNPLVNLPGIYTITVTNATTGCFSTASVTVGQNILLPIADAGSSGSINCIASIVDLDASLSTGNNISYFWSGPGVVTGNNLAQATANLAGWYFILVTSGDNGCTALDSVEIMIDTIVPQLTTGGDSQIGCVSSTTQLSASGNGTTYVWSGPGILSGGNTATPIINQAGEYIVVSTGSNGCTSSDTLNVSQVIGPIADFSVTPNQGPSPLLVTTTNNSSGNGISYLWNLGNGTSSSALNPTTTYNVPGTYSIVLLVTDAAGCTDTTIRTIIVDGLPIDIPNGFTPNGDGFNDYFVIVGLHQYPENKITIFNRWGDPVFSASPYLNNWDGSTSNEKLRISGDKVVDGTYFFILELGAGLEPISGFVELKTR